MNTFTISKDTATLIRDGAAKTKTATGAKKKAAEALAASGARGYYFTKEGVKSGFITKETLAGIQGLIASGLLSKAEFALWAMDSKAANTAGKQDERNSLTSEVNAYLASFRGMIETAWARLFPEEAKAEKDAANASKKSKDESKDAPEKTGGDVRKMLVALILEFAGMDCENHDAILEHLNAAEALMPW